MPHGWVVYRCDAGHAVGMGHVTRGLALAESLRRDFKIVFAGRLEEAARRRITAAGHDLELWNGKDEAQWLDACLRAHGRPLLVSDMRTALSGDELLQLKPLMSGLVVLDDASDRRLAADLAILPPTQVARALDWPGFRGEIKIGWDWLVLGRPPLGDGAQEERLSPPWRLLVSMGGADPNGLTLRAAHALGRFGGELAPTFVLGPAFSHRTAQADSIRASLPSAEVVWQTDDLRPYMSRCDAALTAYGVTAQELAAAGAPALYICLSDDHAQSAAALAETGAGVSLGRFDLLSETTLAETVMTLLRDAGRRRTMRQVGPDVIDGRGADRIAAEMVRMVSVRATAGC